MRYIISILIENEVGALSRVAGLFSARGYNIESLTVAPTEDASLSRMTIVTCGTESIIEQISKQLNKLVDVVKLNNLIEDAHIEREMMLIKINVAQVSKQELMHLVDIFRGRVIDVASDIYTVELTGTGDKLDAFIATLEEGAILETVRSGVMGIARGAKALSLQQ